MHQEFDPRDLEPSLPARDDRPVRSKIAPIMIALVALAGFGGVVWYAYDQGVRQAAPPGATPLIKADNGPTKVRPEQPGGMDVPHQNSLVLNSLPDGDKSGTPPVERLLPPAETPLPRPTASAPIVAAPPAVAPAPLTGAPATPSLPPKIGPAPTQAAVAPVIPAPLQAGPAQPVPPQTASVPPTPIAAPTPPAAQPAPRPVAPTAAPTAAATAAATAPKPAPAAATNGSGYRVRLVSVKSQDQTGQEWARLQRMYPQLAALQMSVTRVELGEKGVWYRIHAGPLSDAQAASQLCSAITAKDKSQGCLVEKP